MKLGWSRGQAEFEIVFAKVQPAGGAIDKSGVKGTSDWIS